MSACCGEASLILIRAFHWWSHYSLHVQPEAGTRCSFLLLRVHLFSSHCVLPSPLVSQRINLRPVWTNWANKAYGVTAVSNYFCIWLILVERPEPHCVALTDWISLAGGGVGASFKNCTEATNWFLNEEITEQHFFVAEVCKDVCLSSWGEVNPRGSEKC